MNAPDLPPINHPKRQALGALALMLTGVGGAWALKPRMRRTDVLGPLDLETAVPTEFGDWRAAPEAGNQIVDPQTRNFIASTYTQTLSRTYANSEGKRIMLSLAYGAELSDTGMGLHYPEVCYPAQGFKVQGNEKTLLKLQSGSIKARQLFTTYTDTRFEPVTYWTMIGPYAEYAGLERKWAEVSQGLQGLRPDGLLFRISNLSRDPEIGYALNRQFANDLVTALAPPVRERLSGLK
jgi:EpsI family protein